MGLVDDQLPRPSTHAPAVLKNDGNLADIEQYRDPQLTTLGIGRRAMAVCFVSDPEKEVVNLIAVSMIVE